MNNTSTNSTSTYAVTIAERYFMCVFSTLCGLASFFANLLMAWGIYRCNQMRSRFYCILTFLLSSRALVGILNVNLYVYRFLLYAGLVTTTSRLNCALLGLCYVPFALELVFLVFLAADRVLALFAIAYYRQLTRRQAAIGCYLLVVVSLIYKVSLIFMNDVPFSTQYICGTNDFLSERVAFASQTIDLTLVVLVLMAYFGILISLRLRMRRMRQSPEDNGVLLSIRRQMAVTPTVRNIVLVHCIWTLSAKLFIVLGLGRLPVPAAYLPRLLMIGVVFVMTELVVNVIVLLRTNEEIRRETMNFFRKLKVMPASTGGQNL